MNMHAIRYVGQCDVNIRHSKAVANDYRNDYQPRVWTLNHIINNDIIWNTKHEQYNVTLRKMVEQIPPLEHATRLYWESSSSSPSSYSHFYVGSMYDDIRLHVEPSYTSSADSPFSLISSFTLSNHLLLSMSSSLRSPLYFHYHRPPSYVVFLPSHHMPMPLQPPLLYFLCDFLPLFLSLLFFHY